MPSYLVSAKDSYVPTALYHPDFQAIQSIWATKQAQYNQGLSQLQNIYSSVYNSDVTNTQNAERKQQYIENANNQFKNLSQIDLSIQHNVDQGKNAFKPFENDVALQKDIVATHQYQQGFAKAQALRDSSKAEDRDRYWGGGVRLMQIGQQKLQNGDPNDASIYNVQGWVDNFNVNKYLGDEAAKQKLDISWQKRANGAQIILGKNGPLSEDAYNKWAQNMLYSNQGYIDFTKARVQLDLHSQKENVIQEAAAHGQYLTDKEAMAKVGHNMYEADHSNLVEDLNTNTSKLNELNKKIEDLKSNTTPITDPDAIQKAQAMKAERDMYQQMVDRDNEHLTQLNSDGVKDSYLNNFSAVGGDLLARRYMSRDAANFADSWASTHSSQEIKDDPNYWKQKNYDLSVEKFNADTQYRHKQLELQNKKLDIEANKQSKSGSKSGSGKEKSDEPTYTVDGKATTDVTGYDMVTAFHKEQTDGYNRTFDNNSNSLFGALSMVDNMEPIEAHKLTDQFRGLFTADNVEKYLDQNPELKQYARRFTSSNNKYDIATAITKHAQDALSNVQDPVQKAKLQNYVTDLVGMSSEVEGFVNREQTFLEGQDKYYQDHPEDSKYFRTVAGKKEVIGADYISKKIKSIKAIDGTVLDTKSLGSAYTNGNLSIRYRTQVSGGLGGNFGNDGYYEVNVGGRTLNVSEDEMNKSGLNDLVRDLGKSEDFSKKSKAIQAQSISSDASQYAMGNVVSFKVGKTSTSLDNQGNQVLSGMQNGTDWYAGATDTQGDASRFEGEDVTKFIKAIEPKDLTDKGISMKTLTTRGDRAFVIHLTPQGAERLKAIKGIDDDLIEAAQEGSLEIHLNGTSSADWVKGLPNTADIKANMPFKKEVYASNLEKANGIDYWILPEKDGSGVRMSYRTKVLDQNSGKEVWSDWQEPVLLPSSQYSPEAVKRTLSETRKRAILKIAEGRKSLADKQKASGQNIITYADIFNN